MGETLPREVIEKLLAVRDALTEGDLAEAYHQLYGIACPDFDRLEPWAEWERAGSLGPDAPPLLRLAGAAPAPRAAAHQDALREALGQIVALLDGDKHGRVGGSIAEAAEHSTGPNFWCGACHALKVARAALNPEAR